MSEEEFNAIFSRNLNHYLSITGHSQAELAKYIGVSTASVSNWCKGIKLPRMDKVDKICKYFNINRSDLMSDHAEQSQTSYYMDDKSKDAAQFLFENPEYQVLFDATRKVKPEDIEFVRQMIDRLTNQ